MITNTTQRFWDALASVFLLLWRDRRTRVWLLAPLMLLILGFLLPQKMLIPVKGATTESWDVNSFWAYPWGTSVTHKGVDIFAARGTDVISSTYGIVIYSYEGGKGGMSVMILGPKWRFHYYAHLDDYYASPLQAVRPGTPIGVVGDTGNAKGKSPHLHYAITTPFPYPQLYDSEAVQGWRKMFYLNPDTWLR